MATKQTTKPTIEDIETVEEAFLSDLLEAIDAGIKQVTADHSVNIQKNRYKSMRAIAFQAFSEYFEQGTFDELVTRASANAGNLPKGWELEAADKRAERQKPATTAPAKQTAAKKLTSQTNVQKSAATRKPSVRKGSTVATKEGVVIAEQRHVDQA